MSDPRPLDAIPPVPLPTTKSQLARLGDRLAAGTPAPGDEELYLAFLDAYDRVQVDLVGALRAVCWPEHHVSAPLDFVGRTKTRDTLLDKLRRSPEVKLPYVRDVAGVRIVGDMTLTDQRLVAALLVEVFGGRIIDRLAEPQSGYRALHAAVTFAGLPVEIQVRTRAQHVWAEVFERLADRWGRQIRYGGPPDDPRVPGAVDDGMSLEARIDLVEQLKELSLGWFASLERTLNDVAAAEAGATDDGHPARRAADQARDGYGGGEMTSFLVQYDRRTGDLDVTEFAGDDARHEALSARVKAETTRSSADVEVVVLSADSLDELKRTHGRYFRSASELLRDAIVLEDTVGITDAVEVHVSHG